jgi:UDPglucose 6-dehydrogenase
MKTTVYGLWHLGCVTAACLAAAGHEVVGLDPDDDVVRGLQAGRPPLDEPGLAERVASGLAAGRLSFTTDAASALSGAEVVWLTFDTPVDDDDEADARWVRDRFDAIAPLIPAGTLVLVSSQVPVGFTAGLERDWKHLRFACSPENLRLGQALQAFERPDRVVVGVRREADRQAVSSLLRPFTTRIEWMSIESAEMTKHALNAFLATSVAFANEVARMCEALGADAVDVERGLKSDARIGPGAYLSPGAAFAGGTLARDVRFLSGLGVGRGVATPLLDGVLASNERHKAWVRETVAAALAGAAQPVAAILGLTYKPGTSTLRRSASVELCRWLRSQGVGVRAHDPSVGAAPPEALKGLGVVLCPNARDALAGADVAVLATPWPEYRELQADDVVRAMRRPCVVDPGGFLASALAAEPRVRYVATGRERGGSEARS